MKPKGRMMRKANQAYKAGTLALVSILLLASIVLSVTHAQQSPSSPISQDYRAYLPLVQRQQRFEVFVPLCVADLPSPTHLPLHQPRMSSFDSGLRGFVTRRGENLELDGQPYRFVGVNAAYLAGPWFPEDRAEEVIAFLAQAGVQVIRVWVQPWCSLDRVERMLDLGSKYNVRFILTLQDFYGNEDGWWFKEKYKTIDLPHIRSIVPLFADRPEIVMWELMNEPTCPWRDANPACWEALYHWAQETSQEVKRLDPNHLVSVGTQRAGFDEQAIEAFRRIHALDTIDAISVHGEVGKLHQGEMRKELAIAHELGKPIYFGEMNMRGHKENCEPLPGDALQRRAQAIADDIPQCFEAGVDGYLLWEFAYGGVKTDNHTTYFCSVFGYFANDPVWEMLKKAQP
jgi:hypothetical protein